MTVRGEFKTPGGKLIAVELDVVDCRLTGVVVTGDFFLYPEDALPALASALEGSPADATEATHAALVRQALSHGIELLGSSPEALAAAVQRALATRESAEHRDGC
jgi:lipoate-protein ligase A